MRRIDTDEYETDSPCELVPFCSTWALATQGEMSRVGIRPTT